MELKNEDYVVVMAGIENLASFWQVQTQRILPERSFFVVKGVEILYGSKKSFDKIRETAVKMKK